MITLNATNRAISVHTDKANEPFDIRFDLAILKLLEKTIQPTRYEVVSPPPTVVLRARKGGEGKRGSSIKMARHNDQPPPTPFGLPAATTISPKPPYSTRGPSALKHKKQEKIAQALRPPRI